MLTDREFRQISSSLFLSSNRVMNEDGKMRYKIDFVSFMQILSEYLEKPGIEWSIDRDKNTLSIKHRQSDVPFMEVPCDIDQESGNSIILTRGSPIKRGEE